MRLTTNIVALFLFVCPFFQFINQMNQIFNTAKLNEEFFEAPVIFYSGRYESRDFLILTNTTSLWVRSF